MQMEIAFLIFSASFCDSVFLSIFFLLNRQSRNKSGSVVCAGFNQTDQALTVYLQHHSGSGQEKIWTQAEKSRGIWIASDVTFQTSQPAKVRGRRDV